MTLNPPLDASGKPKKVNGEIFLIEKDGVEFEFKLSGGNKYTGKGQVNKFLIYNLFYEI